MIAYAACVFKLMTLVPLHVLGVQYNMVHNTIHTLLSIKIAGYNDILGNFSLVVLHTRLISRYKDSISYHDLENNILISYCISHITNPYICVTHCYIP